MQRVFADVIDLFISAFAVRFRNLGHESVAGMTR